MLFTLAYLGSRGKLAIFFPRAVRKTCPSFFSAAPSRSKWSTAERTASGMNIRNYDYNTWTVTWGAHRFMTSNILPGEGLDMKSKFITSGIPRAMSCSITLAKLHLQQNRRTGHSNTMTYIKSMWSNDAPSFIWSRTLAFYLWISGTVMGMRLSNSCSV